jgi:uncharacterized protein (UPF0335 family)
MDIIGDNAKQQLLSVIERIENREEAKCEIQEEVKDIYAEAKGVGYDVAALRAIVRMRREDPSKRAEREAIIETYAVALGVS